MGSFACGWLLLLEFTCFDLSPCPIRKAARAFVKLYWGEFVRYQEYKGEGMMVKTGIWM